MNEIKYNNYNFLRSYLFLISKFFYFLLSIYLIFIYNIFYDKIDLYEDNLLYKYKEYFMNDSKFKKIILYSLIKYFNISTITLFILSFIFWNNKLKSMIFALSIYLYWTAILYVNIFLQISRPYWNDIDNSFKPVICLRSYSTPDFNLSFLIGLFFYLNIYFKYFKIKYIKIKQIIFFITYFFYFIFICFLLYIDFQIYLFSILNTINISWLVIYLLRKLKKKIEWFIESLTINFKYKNNSKNKGIIIILCICILNILINNYDKNFNNLNTSNYITCSKIDYSDKSSGYFFSLVGFYPTLYYGELSFILLGFILGLKWFFKTISANKNIFKLSKNSKIKIIILYFLIIIIFTVIYYVIDYYEYEIETVLIDIKLSFIFYFYWLFVAFFWYGVLTLILTKSNKKVIKKSTDKKLN